MQERRPGALSRDQVKRKIEEIGVGGVAEIIRIGFDGQAEELPINVEIKHIHKTGFSGRVVNVERRLIEGTSDGRVHTRGGGGIIEFNFDDGDIKSIDENQDYQELSAERDISGIVAALSALEEGDRISVAYFDKKHRGTVNFEGVLTAKLAGSRAFRMTIEKINGVKLEKGIHKQFNIQSELVIDVSIL